MGTGSLISSPAGSSDKEMMGVESDGLGFEHHGAAAPPIIEQEGEQAG